MAEASTSTDQATPGPQQRRSDPLPGSYTVVWSTRNNRDEPNFVKINPTFGDGDTSRWPESGPDMTLLGNDHDKQRQWRKTAGELLAKDLGHYSSEFLSHLTLSRRFGFTDLALHRRERSTLDASGSAERIRSVPTSYAPKGRTDSARRRQEASTRSIHLWSVRSSPSNPSFLALVLEKR